MGVLFSQSSRERRMGVSQVGVDAFGAAIQCVLRRAQLDTATGALASGPARSAKTPPEMPGRRRRRPALHPAREITGGCVERRPFASRAGELALLESGSILISAAVGAALCRLFNWARVH